MHLSFTDIAANRADLSTADAVALVLAAANESERSGGLPAPENILLSSDGRVSFPAAGDEAIDSSRVKRLATLLHRLLGFEDLPGGECRIQAPGALLVLIARAAGQIDLPAPSFSAFRDALGRFGSPDRMTLSSVYWRSVRHHSDGDAPAPQAPHAASVLPFRGQMISPSPLRERRVHGPRISDLRRELHETELQLFRALQRNRRSRARRIAAARGAVAASLLIAAVALSGIFGFPTRQVPDAAPERAVAPSDTTAARPEVSRTTALPDIRQTAAPSDAPRTTAVELPPVAATHVSEPPLARRPDVSVRPLLSSTVIGADVFSPSFAQQGRELLFHAGRDRAALMRVSFAEDGHPVVATVLQDTAANYHGSLSPDGKWLAYDSDRDGTRGVYLAGADGGESRRVSGDGYAAVPRWSFDGRRLAFIKAEPARPRVWNVWVADLDAQTLSRVSRHAVGQAWSGSWFPDGEHIAYSVEDTLVVADLQGGTARVVRSPRPGHLIRTPAVSPDGKWIVFQVHRDGAWLLDVSTGAMRRLLADPAAEEFAWSPDGRRLVYHTLRRGAWSLWQMEWDPDAAS